MKSGKLYLLLLVAGALLICFYIALSDIKPVEPGRAKVLRKYGNLDEDKYGYRNISDVTEAKRSDSELMAKRVSTLRRHCQRLQLQGVNLGQIQRSKLDHIIVDDKHKLLYCYVPKVACTNLKRIFLLLTGKMNQTDPLKLQSGDVHDKLDDYLQYLDSMEVDEIKERLQEYKKIIFVREPFERVLSAFRNKFMQKGNEYFKQRFGRKIIKKFRRNPTTQSLEKGDDLMFLEFAQYLLHPQTIQLGYNEHWATFTDLCHPCHIQYDFIGKYESLDEDVNLLLEEIGVSDVIRFPERGDTYKTLKTEDILYKFYKDLKPDMIKNLITVYNDDYRFFGYSVPEAVKPLYTDSSTEK